MNWRFRPHFRGITRIYKKYMLSGGYRPLKNSLSCPNEFCRYRFAPLSAAGSLFQPSLSSRISFQPPLSSRISMSDGLQRSLFQLCRSSAFQLLQFPDKERPCHDCHRQIRQRAGYQHAGKPEEFRKDDQQRREEDHLPDKRDRD